MNKKITSRSGAAAVRNGEFSFQPVRLSLAGLLGEEVVESACAARAALAGEEIGALRTLARGEVDFLPEAFLRRQQELLPQVGGTMCAAPAGRSPAGASSGKFVAATNQSMAPLSAFGMFRIGEDGRLYLITKSEHYHTPLGHAFPGYRLLDTARRLGIPNATHNNTRGHITRLLEEKLVSAAGGAVADGESPPDLYRLDRVLNLETGSLAVEAALKMMLAQFYRPEAGMAVPPHAGKTPVLLVLGNEEGRLQANYHGTTVLTQAMRGMWPELHAGLEAGGLWRVVPIRPNCIGDLEAAFARWEQGSSKIAGFFHEIVMMNYGGRLLSKEFLGRAYELCRRHCVPVLCDEIQSCLWHPELFQFLEWGLTPSFVAVGKGFPGGEYPASRLLFSRAMDCLPQFGALVTNGQEELASLAYLVTMHWALANAPVTRRIGDYYAGRMREFGARHPAIIAGVEGSRHLSTLFLRELGAAREFAGAMNRRGFDISTQTYKQDCPPAVLTKLPLIATVETVDFLLGHMEEVAAGL